MDRRDRPVRKATAFGKELSPTLVKPSKRETPRRERRVSNVFGRFLSQFERETLSKTNNKTLGDLDGFDGCEMICNKLYGF